MSFRVENSVAKNLVNMKINVYEILRFALNDNIRLQKNCQYLYLLFTFVMS